MDQKASPYYTLSSFIFIILCLFCKPSFSQQSYLDNDQLDCLNSSSISRGYVCNGRPSSCESIVVFRSTPNYDTSTAIATLLSSKADDIAWINKFPSTDYLIPHGSIVEVPIMCSCSGSIFQHNSRYTIRAQDTYFRIANETYQGMTTCQAMAGQNYYDWGKLQTGMEVMVPVRCACPTENQTINGVTALSIYMVVFGDTVNSISKTFGTEIHKLLEANELKNRTFIFPFTPLLVPLDYGSCQVNSRYFFCSQSCDGCTSPPKLLIALTSVGSGMAFLILVLVGYKVHQWSKRRREKLCKEKFFKENGGHLLQQKLDETGQKAKLFTAEELERATDNYNQCRFLGQGGFGTVYKGMLQDGMIVAVKRSKKIEEKCKEQFINEVIILSQINHRNIVKLLGFCLETEFPLLVYEFVPNGTLSHHIHNKGLKDSSSSLSWESRLKIASEVAGAVAYMHSTTSIPIFHRDIKSSNVLLDEIYSAKDSDFGTSRFVPCDQSHLTTSVQGTFGYMDPEYFRSCKLTDKSDVYSFGVVIVELLTGKQPFTFARDEGKNLLDHFIALDKEDQLVNILDGVVAKEENLDVIRSVAKIATKCLRLNGKKRPSMKQVLFELEGLRKSRDLYLEIVEECESLPSFSMQSSWSADEQEDNTTLSLEFESLQKVYSNTNTCL